MLAKLLSKLVEDQNSEPTRTNRDDEDSSSEANDKNQQEDRAHTQPPVASNSFILADFQEKAPKPLADSHKNKIKYLEMEIE